MRFFVAAMARRAKDAIRGTSVSTKPSRYAPGSARLIYPYRSALIAVEVIAAEDDFERAAAADQMWEAFGIAAGMHSHSDFRLAQSRVFRRLGEPEERIHGDWGHEARHSTLRRRANRQRTFRVAAMARGTKTRARSTFGNGLGPRGLKPDQLLRERSAYRGGR